MAIRSIAITVGFLLGGTAVASAAAQEGGPAVRPVGPSARPTADAVAPAESTVANRDDETNESGDGGGERSGRAGAVYTLSNQTGGNRVLVFDRFSNGSLAPAGSFPTGGFGTGTGLGNQGAVTLSRDHEWLFAVSAGSNEVSVFEVDERRLILRDIVSSGGERPVSVTNFGDLVYVLNAAGAGSIAGFTLSDDGRLTAIADSVRPLSGAAATGAAQVEFCPSGDRLVVTEKPTNLIDTYLIGSDGRANGPVVNASHGATPFGFEFTSRGELIVSEAFGGAADASALSAYDIAGTGMLSVISGTVPTTETAACWVVVTGNDRFAYTTNTGSGSISAYSIDRHTGALTRRDADGRTAVTGDGTSPIDMALSRDSRFLYVLASGTHEIAGFRVNSNNGGLVPIGNVGGLPMGANGLAAR